MKVKSESEVAQSCPTLSDPMDCSLAGSSVHGIFQARVLEWVAIAFSNDVYANGSQIHSPALVLKPAHYVKKLTSLFSTRLQGMGETSCGGRSGETKGRVIRGDSEGRGGKGKRRAAQTNIFQSK